MENIRGGETVADRYASVRGRAGLSKKAFAESLGIHPVVSGDIELGKRDPSRDVLVRLARVYDVDLNWLLTGQGASASMDGNDDGAIVHVDFVDQEAAAGRGVEIDDYAETKRLPVPWSFIAPRKADKVRAVEVRGDSMTGIGLDDRDIVFFAPDERTGDGVHVISIASQLLVKRILFDPSSKSVHLISENASYPVRILSGPDLDTFKVEGRVVGWMHRY